MITRTPPLCSPTLYDNSLESAPPCFYSHSNMHLHIRCRAISYLLIQTRIILPTFFRNMHFSQYICKEWPLINRYTIKPWILKAIWSSTKIDNFQFLAIMNNTIINNLLYLCFHYWTISKTHGLLEITQRMISLEKIIWRSQQWVQHNTHCS